MKTFIVVALVLIASFASASPFLVCDPQTGVTEYEVTGWPAQPIVTAQPDGSLRMDVASAPVGTTALGIKACANDPIWGRSCSATSNFSLVRPTLPLVPSGTKLVK